MSSADAASAGLPVLPDDTASFDGDDVTVRSTDPTRTLHALTGWALESGRRLDRLTVERASLEDVYLDLTSEPS